MASPPRPYGKPILIGGLFYVFLVFFQKKQGYNIRGLTDEPQTDDRVEYPSVKICRSKED